MAQPRHSADEIEQRARSILETVPDEIKANRIWRDADWTRLIKCKFDKVGTEWKYKVCATGFGPWRREWIRYDMMWVEMTNEDRDLARVALVLESEWLKKSEEDIEPDFQKLIVARADLRVMIFQQRTLEQVRTVMGTLERQAKAFEQKQKGDRYLLAALSKGNFDFHSFTI